MESPCHTANFGKLFNKCSRGLKKLHDMSWNFQLEKIFIAVTPEPFISQNYFWRCRPHKLGWTPRVWRNGKVQLTECKRTEIACGCVCFVRRSIKSEKKNTRVLFCSLGCKKLNLAQGTNFTFATTGRINRIAFAINAGALLFPGGARTSTFLSSDPFLFGFYSHS